MGKVKAGIFDKYHKEFTAVCKYADDMLPEPIDYVIVFNAPGGMCVAGNVSGADQAALLARAAHNRAIETPVGQYNADGVECDDDGEPIKPEDKAS